jgi:hypothetical protein
LIKSVILVALIALAVTGVLDRGLGYGGLGALERSNQEYLSGAFDKALAGFLMLSGIKSGLAIVEGSEVGVGFSLEVGDAVQPLYDYVDIAWRAAMAGGTILVMMQLALKGVMLVDHWVLGATLALFLLSLMMHWLWPQALARFNIFRRCGRWGVTLCVMLYIVLPLSVTLAAQLSQHLTAPLIEASHTRLKALEQNLSPQIINERFFGGQADADLFSLDIKGKLNAMGQGIKALAAYLKTEATQMAALTLKLIAAYVFDCILFPIFFGIILMTLIKSGVSQVFELSWTTKRD